MNCAARERLVREGATVAQPAEPPTTKELFAEYHRKHPDVYRELVKLAFRAKREGRRRIGFKTLWELLRWNYSIAEKVDEDFKLNNNYFPLYSRMVMERNPSLGGFFETRKLKGEK